ncbi:MAG: hypothetical protein FWG66_05450 [Spirochaetes bacterium]|nr:hypothetical protein [Spirochaetota bacterium]
MTPTGGRSVLVLALVAIVVVGVIFGIRAIRLRGRSQVESLPTELVDAAQRLNFEQAYSLFIGRVGQMNASFFPTERFFWDNENQILYFFSQTRDFTNTGALGLVSRPISFFKEMAILFNEDRTIGQTLWNYVYVDAHSWFQIGNPSPESPVITDWFFDAVPNNNVLGTGIDGVINTLIHFESLDIGSSYAFIRGRGGNATITVTGIR